MLRTRPNLTRPAGWRPLIADHGMEESKLSQTILSFTAAMALCCLVSTAAQAKTASNIEKGRDFAKQNCAPCHAVGKTGKSKLPNALPLRILSQRYKLESLEEAFAEGVAVSHKGQKMPAFELEPDTIDNLLKYIKSISVK